MTHAQAVLLVTPISLAMVAWALLKMLELTLPSRPQPVYLANGTVDRLAEAIRSNAQEKQIGLVDNEGHLVISGQRFMVPFEGWEEGTVFIRQKVKAEA